MTKYRNSSASISTSTYNREEIEAPTENIYEALSIIAKRTSQINLDIRKELHEKLDEFATHNDSLEEIFENKEQIEVSKFYERLPKPQAIAIEEWLNDKIYHRNTEDHNE
ncbi:MAG: DNA-directed RNA polymerase subunit omega [Flavobacteriaceae bacterium]|nr:DNA-directed RNA polymerase subunit omega [Bacteroidota bacterium]